MPQIEVTFDIDANGILNVSARDKATGKQQNITITRLVRPHQGRDRADEEGGRGQRGRRRPAASEEIEVRNQADSLVYSTERTLSEHGDKLADADSKAIEAALTETREALKGEDLERIKKAQEALTKARTSWPRSMYREAQAKASAGPRAAPSRRRRERRRPQGGDVVDAEFEDLGEKK